MVAQHTAVERFEDDIPGDLARFADIYFTWSREAAEAADLNPVVTKYVHAGPDGEADVAGLQETARVYDAMTDDQIAIYLTEHDTFTDREPLMLVEGPVRQLFEPETPVLGTLSYHLTGANEDLGYSHPTPEEYGEGVDRITTMLDDLSEAIDEDIGFADFGARHYHPARQPALAKAAYENGAIGHSTTKGVEAINDAFDADLEASGTMPHAFVLTAAADHPLEDATFEAFKRYAEAVEGPTPVLIDTNNTELEDTLRICDHLAAKNEEFDLVVRMDTNGANHAQTVPPEERRPDTKGMSVEAVRGMSEALHENGYRDNVTFLISSGMGKTDKLERFVDAAKEYHAEHGIPMFDGVGAGSFDTTNTLYTTSDIVQVEGEWLGKVGRLGALQERVDHDLETYREEHMTRYTA